MIAHHEGAVRMAQTEIDSGQSEPAVHLAHEIVDTQQREIDTMKEILGRCLSRGSIAHANPRPAGHIRPRDGGRRHRR